MFLLHYIFKAGGIVMVLGGFSIVGIAAFKKEWFGDLIEQDMYVYGISQTVNNDKENEEFIHDEPSKNYQCKIDGDPFNCIIAEAALDEKKWSSRDKFSTDKQEAEYNKDVLQRCATKRQQNLQNKFIYQIPKGMIWKTNSNS